MENSKVYVPDKEHGWVAATLVGVLDGGKKAEVQVDADDFLGLPGGEARTVELSSPELKATDGALPLQNLNVPGDGVEDMCTLSFLHEPAILFNLRQCFVMRHPYTYTGDICIAVNPYEWLEHLYREDVRESYLHTADRARLPPHVYAVSAAAYKGVVHEEVHQSILVSGESGAGKTETVKILMSHLASICESAEGDGHEESRLEQGGVDDAQEEREGEEAEEKEVIRQQHRTIEKVLESNPLLESFGNAKTVRNDNSSRFGKFTQLQLERLTRSGDFKLALVGSKCVHYLLEKSRVTQHSEGERNFHIFYQILSASEEAKAGFGLSGKTQKDFRYMTCGHGGSDTTVIEGRSDPQRYLSTIHALGLIGVSRPVQLQMLRTLAAILYLGEVAFIGHEGSGGEEARIQIADAGRPLYNAAELLDCDVAVLTKALTFRTVRSRNESYEVPLTTAQALDGRDALAKELYSRLFNWLVLRINESTSVPEALTHDRQLHVVGLLDIFGFESFAVNRMEQLCINWCNEKIQQKFTADVFKTVQAEYEEEGITWDFIEFKDNVPVLDLIEGRMGLVTVLNEECMLPKGGDVSFISKLTTLHAEHPHLMKDRLNKTDFTIHHYAGSVKYTAEGFVVRNKDTLQEDLINALAASRGELVRGLFTSAQTSGDGSSGQDGGGAGGGRKKGTIGALTVTTKFKSQLNELMETIAATKAHYIRCIKPNRVKSNSRMDQRLVMEQLRCAGVVEAIRISRAAFPNRLDYLSLLQRFRMLDPGCCAVTPRALDDSSLVRESRRLLLRLLPTRDGERERFEMGRTRVYFQAGALEEIEERRNKLLGTTCTVIQRYIRGWRAAKAYRAQKSAAIHVQAAVRAWRARASYKRERRRVIKLQGLCRRRRAQKELHRRRIFTRSTQIQATARGFVQRRKYRMSKGAAICLQSMARMRIARKAYKGALAEAREQAKLENQLEALKKRLEQESQARLLAEEKLLQQQKHTAHLPPRPPTPGGTIVHAGVNGGSLSSEQGAMLEFLRTKVIKFRDQCLAFKRENDALKAEVQNLRAENQRVKDAHAAAAKSYAALNQHSAQLERTNKRLTREHQEAVLEANNIEEQARKAIERIQDETVQQVDKLKLQLKRAKDESVARQDMYSLEVQLRHKQDIAMTNMVNMVRKRMNTKVDGDLIDELQEVQRTCAINVSMTRNTMDDDDDSGGGAALRKASRLVTSILGAFGGGSDV